MATSILRAAVLGVSVCAKFKSRHSFRPCSGNDEARVTVGAHAAQGCVAVYGSVCAAGGYP
eukprot:scaffold19112_cov152-Isochrysis_galbana.AAC.1